MNDELEMELEIVELGDAKEETKGAQTALPGEPESQYHFRPE
jgi:hypothetical protein